MGRLHSFNHKNKLYHHIVVIFTVTIAFAAAAAAAAAAAHPHPPPQSSYKIDHSQHGQGLKTSVN
jgi:Spy/CpxP family protein refolding chaperone